MKLDLKKSKNNVQKVAKFVGHTAQDVAVFAVKKGKAGGSVAKEKYVITKKEIEKKRLSPIFRDKIGEILEVTEPFLIRVVDSDKRRQESEVCKGSIGFWEKIKGESILHIYTKDADELGIELYPCVQDGLFCPNPFKENMYIALDDYFDYIKKAKIDELETIGHKLGAKYVKITFKEKKTYFTSNQKKAKVKANKDNDIEISNKNSEQERLLE